MTIQPIITLGDPRLRLKGEPVDSFGKYLHELLDDLTETMRAAPGVGLAAPQLGVALQALDLFVGEPQSRHHRDVAHFFSCKQIDLPDDYTLETGS